MASEEAEATAAAAGAGEAAGGAGPGMKAAPVEEAPAPAGPPAPAAPAPRRGRSFTPSRWVPPLPGPPQPPLPYPARGGGVPVRAVGGSPAIALPPPHPSPAAAWLSMADAPGGHPASTARHATSWSEDCRTYREERGGRSLATMAEADPAWLARCREIATSGPAVQTNVDVLEPRRSRPPADAQEKGVRLVEGAGPGTGANRPAPKGTTERKDLFGVMQGAGKPTPDSWIGHTLVDPTKGKAVAEPQPDAKGRKDLFAVIDQSDPGKPKDDSWMGHVLVDPAKGKANPPAPDVKTGRRGLFSILNQTGEDTGNDSWIGNQLVDPTKGKAYVEPPSVQKGRKDLFPVMQMKGPPIGEVKYGNVKMVKSKASRTTIGEVLQNCTLGPQSPQGGRKVLKHKDPGGRKDLFQIMGNEFKDDTSKKPWMDGAKPTGTKVLAVPGSDGKIGSTAGRGSSMLYWDHAKMLVRPTF